jgi:membrane fusion protein (multidrug efflux system)
MTATVNSESILHPAPELALDARVADAPASAKATTKRPRALYVLGALLAAAAVGVSAFYVHDLGREATDDAQVEGRIMNVSARIPAQVARVLVEDNQIVNEGDLLVELDKGDLAARVESARADVAAVRAQLANAKAQLALTERNAEANVTQAKGGLTQAVATLTSSEAAIAQGQADAEAARSRLALAELDRKRATSLLAQGAVAQAEVDTANTSYDTAKGALDQATARLEAARAGTRGSGGGIVLAQGRLQAAMTGPEQIEAQKAAVALAEARANQSEAALKIAELNLSYTEIRAPRRGEVSRRTVEVGQQVGTDRALLAIVPIDDVWIVANFKEDQLRDMHPGQPVAVELDTYGRRHFAAHVDSIAGASGARFALLPPDNATGNYIKVVQRVPVLIRFDGDPQAALRPGMSADVTVDTRAH